MDVAGNGSLSKNKGLIYPVCWEQGSAGLRAAPVVCASKPWASPTPIPLLLCVGLDQSRALRCHVNRAV